MARQKTRVGAVFSPYHHAPEDLRPAVQAAEAAGVPELWLWEDCFRESAYASVAAALAWSDTLRIGLGITPFPLRNVAVTAMEIATIERMFPGRFLPGLGHGVLPWMSQAGVRAASPLTLMREYLPALRSLLAGEEVSVAGRYVSLDRVRLDYPPETPPPIYSAGEGPKTLGLTGQVADGTIFVSGLTPTTVREHIQRVREGHAVAGRDGGLTFIAYVTAAFGAGAEERVRAELDDSEPVADRALWDSPEEVAAGVRHFADAGADAVILSPATGERDFRAFLDATGEVGRLLA